MFYSLDLSADRSKTLIFNLLKKITEPLKLINYQNKQSAIKLLIVQINFFTFFVPGS